MEDLALKGLLSKLADLLVCENVDSVPSSKKNYVAWCLPGLAFQKEDLDFIKDPTLKSAEAAQFSLVVNSIPSGHEVNTFEQNNSMLWAVYRDALELSKVSDKGALTENEKTKMADNETAIAAMDEAYSNAMVDYLGAVSAYQDMKIAAMELKDPHAVRTFTTKGQLQLKIVQKLFNNWISAGHKNEYEQMVAYNEVTPLKDMNLYKKKLLDKMNEDLYMLTDPVFGAFYPTTFSPANFVNNEKGWTHISYNSEMAKSYSQRHSESVSGGASLFWGLWKTKGAGNYDKVSGKSMDDDEKFEVSFSMTQVVLGRPWFAPSFLLSRAWDWATPQAPLSGGTGAATDRLPAYATNAVFIKDVTIKSRVLAEELKNSETEISVGGSLGWGVFKFGANYKQTDSENSRNYSVSGDTVKIEGLQLIALKCFAMPKCPDPVETIQ